MPYIGNQVFQGVINSDNIVDGSIDTIDLKDGSVTGAKLEALAGLTAGSYTITNLTVDGKGRVTAISNGTTVYTKQEADAKFVTGFTIDAGVASSTANDYLQINAVDGGTYPWQ